jgi:sporulation protein YlmC with PRC-barrel domain
MPLPLWRHSQRPHSRQKRCRACRPIVSPSTDYYKQDVYDNGKNSVGKIDDVLIDKSGKITALIVGVGGFLGVGEKDVALPFAAVKAEKKDKIISGT